MRFGPLAILGDVEPGKTLIARTSSVLTDHRELAQGSERFQWLRDGQPIEGETLRTYTIKPADIGHALALAYSFQAYGEEQQVISEPKAVDLGYWRNLYWRELGREPDPAGLAWWQDRVAQLFKDSIG